jgi:hypothetical protein
MSIRPKTHLLFPLLALSLTLAAAGSVQAQDRHYSNDAPRVQDHDANMTFQVDFGGNPRWSGIRGTRVQEVRGTNRPQYDMFRYGGAYYVYNDDRWYMSRRARGQFVAIDDRNVPRAFSQVSRDHWRNTTWMDHNPDTNEGRRGRRHSNGY